MAKKAATEHAPLFAGLNLDQVHPVETVTEEQAEKYQFDTVDFSDPNRPKTCLEVDFPILKVNEISAIEQNATKPIYMMSKWWARRRASVFRQLLISAATKAPADESKAAQTSWSLMYRKNHQKHGKFSNLKVVDIFMGGGTTVVEAARLGFNVTGVDINPIAWWVVKNETTPVAPEKLNDFAQYVEKRVKPQIMPFLTAKSPRGFNGKWIKNGSECDLNVSTVSLEDRSAYKWEGPEVIYTFWMKHIMCADPDCNHLTPQFGSSVVAIKSLKVKYLPDCVCPHCKEVFDFEYGDFKMAPNAKFILGDNTSPFVSLTPGQNSTKCCHCNKDLDLEWISKQEKQKAAKTREVEHSLLLPKKWLNGITAPSKKHYGGYFGASISQDETWFGDRAKDLHLIEVRGDIPTKLKHSNFGKKQSKDPEDEEAKSSGQLICGKCGRQQDPLDSIKLMGHLAPSFPYLIQGFDPEAKNRKFPYGGRFFDLPNFDQIISAIKEFNQRIDLKPYVPNAAIPYGCETNLRKNLPAHQYTHWYMMFNPRQLYFNSLLLKEIVEAPDMQFGTMEKSHALGGWQNYLRHNCMFTIWNLGGDKLEPHFANNNYHPKATTVENGVFSDLGRGNFASCIANVIKGLEFAFKPYDLKVNTSGNGGKSIQIDSDDAINSKFSNVLCQSSTDLKKEIATGSVDLVITDPPFGDNLNYAELADFFVAWLAKPLSILFPSIPQSHESPKTLEAVANKARHPGKDASGKFKSDIMYDRLLSLCWTEAARILKPSGLLAFTFHHDKDDAWINVLESLFKSGFIIEAAFPIRSDATKGEGRGAFGSKKIEYDIVHVCKKRLEAPKEVYWATLRKDILSSVKSKSFLLAQHEASGLHLADLEVIIRGEVLEQYSKHYGAVKKNLAGDLISVKEILLEANSIAQNLLQANEQEKLPDSIEVNTRTLFSLFRDGTAIEYNAAKKRLKGSGVSLEELVELGWVTIVKKSNERISTISTPQDRWNSLTRKKSLIFDLDQAHFAVNCCLGGKQLDGKPADLESWVEAHYKSLLPSVVPLLKYMEGNHFGADYKQAIGMAHRTIERTLNKIKETDGEYKKASDQLSLFE